MLKARPSFPSAVYEKNKPPVESDGGDRVADIMARYYTRMEEIFKTEVTGQNELADGQTVDNSHECGIISGSIAGAGRLNSVTAPLDTPRLDMREYMNNIKKSRRKVKQISNVINKFDDNMKELENEGQLLITVRENLDNLGLNFWDWLLDGDLQAISKPASSN